MPDPVIIYMSTETHIGEIWIYKVPFVDVSSAAEKGVKTN